jgi:hypothetical protein
LHARPEEFDVAQTIRLSFAGESSAAGVLRKALDPWEPVSSKRPAESPADVTIEELQEAPTLVELQNPAGDGLVTAWSGSDLYVRAGGRYCRVPAPALEGPFDFGFERGFPLAAVIRPFVRPALQIAASAHGAVVVHGAAAVVDGKGVVVAGWSESGKTETVVALLEEGASFLSDKWTVIRADGTVACFPITVGIRRSVLEYAPRLRAALPAAARLRLRVAGGVATVAESRPRKRLLSGMTGDALERLMIAAERVSMSPTDLAAAYDAPPPRATPALGAVVLLTTSPHGEPNAVSADPAWAARRLARSATYERGRFLDLERRRRFARTLPESLDIVGEIEAREEGRLVSLLDKVPVIEARAPFPCDPRRIVAAVRPLL